MKLSREDQKTLTAIYREVVACHYYQDGVQYCADLLDISPNYVRRIAAVVRGKKIIELKNQDKTNEEIAEAIGCRLSRVEGLIRTSMLNEAELTWM